MSHPQTRSHQDSTNPNGPGRFEISDVVTYNVGTIQVQREIPGRTQYHSRRWFSTIASVIGYVGAKVTGIDSRSVSLHFVQNVAIDVDRVLQSDDTAPDCRLVGDDHQGIVRYVQPPQCLESSRDEVHLFPGFHVIGPILDDNSVAIEKHDSLRRLRSAHCVNKHSCCSAVFSNQFCEISALCGIVVDHSDYDTAVTPGIPKSLVPWTARFFASASPRLRTTLFQVLCGEPLVTQFCTCSLLTII